ncbi:unnamed protein product [Caenorhabditis angaria]|uniref:Uncharacterized protein n=1 Tax=Caenorhabditis angaria TaxID=860376 RepID=A0A9P1MU94_9PELO|nr:unnamed protein product [Caenorhabditis angaria]
MKRRTIHEMIDGEYSYTTKEFFHRYVEAIRNPTGYFVSLMRRSLDGEDYRAMIGERRLIRIIFSRAGVDLPEIVEEFGGKEKLIGEIGKSEVLHWFTKQALIAILNANLMF